ncbi:MAG: ribosome biogenesis GTPase Der [Candidatus Omnitrophota bacterium]
MKLNSHTFPKIAIIGRPNVGKSTLFNRILKRRKAIVEKGESTTRDRITGIVEHSGYTFELIDTGGVDFNKKKNLFREVEKQIITAIHQSDEIIFVCDVKTGVMPLDQKICGLLRSFNKKVMLVVNKVDNNALLQNCMEFYSLGFGEPVPVSSIHGSGVWDLLDLVVSGAKALGRAEPRAGAGGQSLRSRAQLAVVGRPNSGKSSFVNAVLGEERVIVSPEPGTTRDSVDSYFEIDGKGFVIIDTAGIRSKNKIKDDAMYYSIVRAEESIKKSNVVLILLDGMLGVTKEDFRIIGSVQKGLKPFIVGINKWDLCQKQGIKAKDYELAVRSALKFIYNTPILFMSALTGKNIKEGLDIAYALAEKSRTNFSTSRLNEILKQITIKATRLYSIRQARQRVPEFEIFAKNPSAIKDSDRRHIANILRKELELEGIPIKIIFKKKSF